MGVTDEDIPCKRCHGTGREPLPKEIKRYDDDAKQELLDRLVAAGRKRATSSRHNATGLAALDDAYNEIRVVAAEATRVGLTRNEMAEAVGVGRAQLYNIISGKTKV